jgi:hypothetical protein
MEHRTLNTRPAVFAIVTRNSTEEQERLGEHPALRRMQLNAAVFSNDQPIESLLDKHLGLHGSRSPSQTDFLMNSAKRQHRATEP